LLAPPFGGARFPQNFSRWKQKNKKGDTLGPPTRPRVSKMNSHKNWQSDKIKNQRGKHMEQFLIYFVAGFCGGVIRGLVGFVKNKTLEKINHFKPQYFLITISISGVVGAAAGILADTEWQVSFLAGYAGVDFIESLYKIKIAQNKSSSAKT